MTTTTQLSIPVRAEDHSQGSAMAAITLVEYGDYQCPYCRAAYPLVKELQREFAGSLRFVFRNFPLTEWHPLAHQAAQLAEAAATLGRFWPMHDWLFENQERWSESGAEELLGGAAAVGLDIGAVERALRQPQISRRIESDFKGGLRSGVNGTPGFFVNGQLHHGAPQGLGVVMQRILVREPTAADRQ
jgi:protein-disulfide isomerase